MSKKFLCYPKKKSWKNTSLCRNRMRNWEYGTYKLNRTIAMRLISNIPIENMFDSSSNSKLMRKISNKLIFKHWKLWKIWTKHVYRATKKSDTLISSYHLPVIKFRHHNFARNSFHFYGTRSNCKLAAKNKKREPNDRMRSEKENKRKMNQLRCMHYFSVFWKLHDNNRSLMVHHWLFKKAYYVAPHCIACMHFSLIFLTSARFVRKLVGSKLDHV